MARTTCPPLPPCPPAPPPPPLQTRTHHTPVPPTPCVSLPQLLEKYSGKEHDMYLQRLAFNAQQFALKNLCPHARLLYLRRLLKRYNELIPDMQK